MLLAVAQAVYLFAPLLVSAALSAVVLRFDLVRALARPIDGGRTWRGRRLFGDNKTWRGVAVAVVGCVVTAAAQRWIAPVTRGLAVVPYERVAPLPFGAVMGVAAMLGELPNSFVKRRLDIAPGQSRGGAWGVLFYVWDQVDLLSLTWPALRIWVRPGVAIVVASFAVALVLHPLVSLLGFALGARRTAR